MVELSKSLAKARRAMARSTIAKRLCQSVGACILLKVEEGEII